MRGFSRNKVGGVGRDQKGFTLIEMLVVVGIIVALAAIIVPLVISFSGSGKEAAQEGERETLQTAIQTMMLDNDLTGVTASGATSVKALSTGTQFHASITLANYMDQASTQYCYQWGTDGRVTFQHDITDAGACDATDQVYP